MGKRTRDKKAVKLAHEQELKVAAIQRKKDRLAPSISLARKLLITLVLTVLILYFGRFVNIHIRGIIHRILERS